MAESRELGYQPTSDEFLEAWASKFLVHITESVSATKGRKGDAAGAPKAGGSSKWRAVDGIWTRVETKVTDGRPP